MTDKRIYSRYYINRGNVVLWKGKPAEPGSLFRQTVITSDAWNSTVATFQVSMLEGTSKGIKNGGIDIDDDEVKILFDEDRKGLKSATEKATELIKQAELEGFEPLTIFALAEYEEQILKSKS